MSDLDKIPVLKDCGDVGKIPISGGRFLLLPDESYKYNVGDVYGMCGSAWKYAA